MAEEILEHDWYAILEVPMSASEEEIGKAFRSLARTAHPDRNKDNPNAVARFHLIKKASEVLLDLSMRASYDAQVQARLLRKKRDREASENVQQLKTSLKAREEEARVASLPKEDQLKRLREENAILLAGRAERAAKKAANEARNAAHKAALPASFHISAVVLKWSVKDNAYSESQITAIVKPFGSFEATIMGKTGNQATVLLSSHISAQTLVEKLSPEGDMGIKYGFRSVTLRVGPAPPNSSSVNLASSSAAPTPSTSVPRHDPINKTAGPSKPSEKVAEVMADDAFEQLVMASLKGTKKSKIS